MRSKLKVFVAVFLMAAMIFTLLPASTAIAGPNGRGNRKPGKTVEETQALETEAVEADAPIEEVETVIETESVETVEETEAEAAYPYFEDTKTDEESGISVKVEAPEGALPDGTEMVLTALTDSQLSAVADKVDGNVVEAIDIAFWNNGEEIEPRIPIKVTMSSDNIAKVEEPTVVHVPDGDAEVEEVNLVEDAEAAADEVVFEADSFSVYAVVVGEGEAYVHWGYMDGSTFVEFNKSNIDESTGTFSIRGLYEDYTFVQAYYSASELTNPTTGKLINITITKSDAGNWQYEDTDNGAALTDIEPGSHLYAVYVPNGSEGQPPVIPITPTEQNPDPLNTQKTVVPNKNADGTNDGTYRITLKVTGAAQEETHTEASSANVLVILDRSYSMRENMGGNAFPTVKQAAQDLVDAMPNDAAVDFALFQFSVGVKTASNTRVDWTTLDSDSVKTTVKNKIAGFQTPSSAGTGSNGDGGTNWDAALAEALSMANAKKNSGDTDTTYIIFLTDGCPSVNTEQSVSTHNHQSAGTTNPNDRCLSNALDNMQSLVNGGYKVYGIYANTTGDLTRVTANGVTYTDPLAYITTVTGAEGYYKADNTSDLQDVFTALINTITEDFNYSGVAINDGITNLTDISASVSVSGAAGNFEYRRDGGTDEDGNKKYDNELWTSAPTASAGDTGVTWDLSPIGNLEVGVTYSVSFDIWPSQEAYDLVADLNNGKKDYDSLDPEVQEQIGGEGPDGYYLKTNTFLNTTYTFNGNDYQMTGNEGISTMDLDSEIITMKKNWPQNDLDWYEEGAFNDGSTTGTLDELTLTITKDGDPYTTKTLYKNRGWQPAEGYEEVFISCGVMTVKDGVAEVKGTSVGHDYTVIEPPEFSYLWDLIADIYHPMVINGKKTMLILDEDATAADNVNTFEINGKYYTKTESGENLLEADNYRRSNLNLTKVAEFNGNPITGGGEEDFFTYKVTVKDANATDGNVWFSAFDPTIEYQDSETGETKYGATVKDVDWVISGATAEAGNTGYWYATNNTEITFKIKAGWNVRFLNLYHGSTFSFEETAMPDGYELNEITTAHQNEFMKPESEEWFDIDDAVITGTIPEPNNSYTVTYDNKSEAFYVYHSGVAGDGNLEVIKMPSGTYDLTQNVTEGTLYGGYYLDYAGKGTYADDGKAGENGVVYSGMNYNWSSPQTVDGEHMTPAIGETYYIKEVPKYYLRNYYQITYVKSTEELVALYLISAVDDLNYKATGFMLQKTNMQVAKVSSQVKYTNAATGKTVTLKANNVFRRVDGDTAIDKDGEYLTYWKADENYFKEGEFTVLPYWTTPDGIDVNGISTRKITIAEMTKSGITKTDE